jgi:hypothetical protein
MIQKYLTRIGILVCLIAGGLVFQPATPAYSYPVPPLPEDNLVTNPWFLSTSNPTLPGFDGWTPVLVDGVGWGLSQKESNPAPELVVSGTCGFRKVYCGTGARWANESFEGDALSYPDLDVYLYQILEADATHRKLKFSMYWVNHKVDVTEVKIYGSASADGQWTEVWLPFTLSQDTNPPPAGAPGRNGIPWFQTELLETVLTNGYPFYKIEFHARYPQADSNQGDVGVKITGVYFSTAFTDEPEQFSTPVVVYNPTISAPATSEQETAPTVGPATEQGTLQETPQRVRTPSPTPPTLPPPELTATEPPLPSPTAPPVTSAQTPTRQRSPTLAPTATDQGEGQSPSASTEQDGLGRGFILGFISAGILILAVVFIRLATKNATKN